jgi:acyl carrier protein
MTDEIEKVISIIAEIGGKGLPRLEPEQDIYDAGFSSASALQLLQQLEDDFNVQIPDDGRFAAARTPKALHDLIEELLT